MSFAEGLDLLAAYADGSARYYNHAGGGVVLERAEDSLAQLVDALLAAGGDVVAHIGPWEDARPGPPPSGNARLSFLTPSGVCFGEGPAHALSEDAMAGPVLRGATGLVAELVPLVAQN
jgi:hypothetical protein